MQSTLRTARFIGAAIIVGTSVVACGSTGDSDTTDAIEANDRDSAATNPVAEADIVDTDSSSTDSSSTGSNDMDIVDAGAGRSKEAFCATILRLEQRVQDFPGDAETLAGLEELARVAPGEIADNAEAVADLFATLMDFETAVEAGDLDEDDPAYAQADADIDRNGEAMETYIDANCESDF